jgi:hypothetical protein
LIPLFGSAEAKGIYFMKYLIIAMSLLTILTSCKNGSNSTLESTPTQSPVSSIPISSPILPIQPPSPTPALVFDIYKDHVEPNPEIMSLEDRKSLNAMGKELVALLDDYVYDWNHNRKETGVSGDKFGAVDTPSDEVSFGKGVLKIKATKEITVVNEHEVNVIAYAEVRKNEKDQPFWKGNQVFRFTFGPMIKLNYWNESV